MSPRGRDEVAALLAESHPFTTQVSRGEDGQYAVWLEQLAIYGRAASIADAVEDLLDEVLEYVDEWEAGLRQAPKPRHEELVGAPGPTRGGPRRTSADAPGTSPTVRHPRWDDLGRFCEVDGWERKETARGRRSGDHDRFTKTLPNGRILRTRASHGRAEVGDTSLVPHIYRDQLEVSEEEFWRAVDDGVPPARGGAAEPDSAAAATLPAWLAMNLTAVIGMTDAEVADLDEETAIGLISGFTCGAGRVEGVSESLHDRCGRPTNMGTTVAGEWFVWASGIDGRATTRNAADVQNDFCEGAHSP